METTEMVERLSAVAELLEQATLRLTARQCEMAAEAESTLGRIVATVEQQAEGRREAELERKLAEAEMRIAELQAACAETQRNGRKTLAASASSLLAKHGVAAEAAEPGMIDAALAGLSVEQRFAVKAQLLRAGLV